MEGWTAGTVLGATLRRRMVDRHPSIIHSPPTAALGKEVAKLEAVTPLWWCPAQPTTYGSATAARRWCLSVRPACHLLTRPLSFG